MLRMSDLCAFTEPCAFTACKNTTLSPAFKPNVNEWSNISPVGREVVFNSKDRIIFCLLTPKTAKAR
jgi:hypothetical protein